MQKILVTALLLSAAIFTAVATTPVPHDTEPFNGALESTAAAPTTLPVPPGAAKLKVTGKAVVYYTVSEGASAFTVYGSGNSDRQYTFSEREKTIEVIHTPKKMGRKHSGLNITGPALSAVEVSGKGKVYIRNGYSASGIDVTVSGTGEMVFEEPVNVAGMNLILTNKGRIVTNGVNSSGISVSNTGRGTFVSNGLNCSGLSIESSGNGRVDLRGETNCAEAKINFTGKGGFRADRYSCATLNTSLLGRSKVAIKSARAQEIIFVTTGKSRIELGGEAEKTTYYNVGRSKIKARKMTASHIDMIVTGRVKMECTATDSFLGVFSGRSSVDCYGNPGEVNLAGYKRTFRKR